MHKIKKHFSIWFSFISFRFVYDDAEVHNINWNVDKTILKEKF